MVGIVLFHHRDLLTLAHSYRCVDSRLHGELPIVARDIAEDNPALPAHLPLSLASQTRGAGPCDDVDRTQDHTVEAIDASGRLI